MATIRERKTKSGVSFEVMVRRKGHETQTQTFTNRGDAETWADQIESSLVGFNFANLDERKLLKLEHAFRRYLIEVTPGKKGAKRESDRIKKWLSEPISKRAIFGIKEKDIEDLRDLLANNGLSENSIRLEIALFSTVFETARNDWGFEDLPNPCRIIKLTAKSNSRERRITLLEQEYLLAGLQSHCRNLEIVSVVQFELVTAFSQSDILNLDWAAIDLHRKTAKIEDRVIPLSSKAIEILQGKSASVIGTKVFNVTQDGLIRAIPKGCELGRQIYLDTHTSLPSNDFLHDLKFQDLRHEAISNLFELSTLTITDIAYLTGLNEAYLLKKYPHSKIGNIADKLG